jgi:hypothetical protein
MKIRHVKQEDERGCAIASLAMVLGLSYKATAKRFNIPRSGSSYYKWMEVLAQSGWSYQMLWKTDQLTSRAREIWPPEPWAPVHLCQIQTPLGAHMVVMKHDGAILDPALPHSDIEPFRLDITHYTSVDYVAGLFRVRRR